MMTTNEGNKGKRDNECDYLCVDDFIKSIVDARSLATAFELRLIDYLAAKDDVPSSVLIRNFNGSRGLEFLLDLLRVNCVVEGHDGWIRLTPAFRKALQYRDLLEAKIAYANFAAHDFIDHFTDLIADPRQFMKKAAMFRLFAYGRCLEFTKENYEITKRWMSYTSVLTRYEAGVCLSRHDFGRYANMLDIGGNSGEFVLQICKQHRSIRATVFDLPLVCEIGQEHVQNERESERISFIKGNALVDPFPGGFDLVTFKSVLHDWPAKDANLFIAKAARALRPGGTLLIFERAPVEVTGDQLPYSILPMLLFSHTFRPSLLYKEQLSALGFKNVKETRVELEMPFFILSAIAPGPAGA